MTSFYTDKDHGQENAFMNLTRRRRTRTVRTALSCPCQAGQTDNEQSFFEKSGQIRTADRIETDRFRTEFRQQTDTAQDFPENPDENETQTGYSQLVFF